MYRITLECHDVPAAAGYEAARNITEAFRLHYPHEHNVSCTFVDGKLRLVAENDYDPEGLNLMDEFSDNISAYVEPFDGDLKLVSVETLRGICPRRLGSEAIADLAIYHARLTKGVGLRAKCNP